MWSHIPTLLIFEHLRISGTYTLWLFSVREEWQPRTRAALPNAVGGTVCAGRFMPVDATIDTPSVRSATY
jgi:hypothetical protein